MRMRSGGADGGGEAREEEEGQCSDTHRIPARLEFRRAASPSGRDHESHVNQVDRADSRPLSAREYCPQVQYLRADCGRVDRLPLQFAICNQRLQRVGDVLHDAVHIRPSRKPSACLSRLPSASRPPATAPTCLPPAHPA